MDTHNTSIENKINQLVNNQRDYFQSNETLAYQFRLKQLKKFKQLLIEHEEEMHEAIYKDFGKSKYENQLTEIFPLMEEIEIALKNLKKWMKPEKLRTNLMNFPAKSYLVSEPLGVSLVIGAWNFPYNLSLAPVIGSMAAGNTTILKPSELPENTSKVMEKIINTNFDPRYLHVVEGAIPETTALLKQRYDKIFFTGSPVVGKIVNRAAAEHLTNVTLELGGKNPVLFHEDASLKNGVKRIIWAKFVNSGQLCIAPDYILVHNKVKDKFLEAAKQEIIKANYSDSNNNFVQIINNRNFDRILNLIDKKKVYHGGTYDREDRRIEPTILHNITTKDPIMQEEIFGPLLPVIGYDTIDEAFKIIKEMEKPLAGYVYTRSKKIKERFLAEIPFGSGGVNECVMQVNNPNIPFGGVGNSGMGRYHGKYSFECFSHFKGVVEKNTIIEPNLKYYGYNEKKLKLIKKLS